MAKNFDYLKEREHFGTLYNYCDEAESFQKRDPDKSALACRKALEWIVMLIYKCNHWEISAHASLFELVKAQDFVDFINSPELMQKLHFVRSVGNRAAHSGGVSEKDSYFAVMDVYYFIGDVLMLLGFADNYPKFDRNIIPDKESLVMVVPTPQEVEEPADDMTEGHENKKQCALIAHNPDNLSEHETRKIYIDEMLREAGWSIAEYDGEIVSGKVCTEIEVAGMPNASHVGFADYVIFDTDGKPLAVIEAKKTTVDPVVGKKQAELYADCLEKKYGIRPVIYYTNGFETNVIDGLGYPARTIYGFHSRLDLQKILQKRGRTNIEDMKSNLSIVDRDYQLRAVKNVCEHFNKKFRRALLVMATGTGKTRVAIALVDVLIRNNWIKNVLFLADRTALVDQAYKNFNKLLPDESKCNLCDNRQNRNIDARLLFSTYQTMINFIDAEDKQFSVGRFDLIVIDEAHRSVFGKYGAIFDYFDSLLIGLTATPRDEIDRSTYKLMNLEDGEPTDCYEYKEAVKDGYLVDFEAYRYDSDILKNGIKYNDRSEEEKKQLDTIFEHETQSFGGEVLETRDIGSNEIFHYIYNDDTIDKVLQKLMENGIKVNSGENVGKTIIFAYNHEHAVKIVKRFEVLYPQYGDKYCYVIDYQETYKKSLIDDFEKPDGNPRIAVSVDMMDTGIDVPEVVNLVFFKVIRSKIKFWQMIGRGTRLSKNLFGHGKDKKKFLIFDFCNNFDYFDENPEGVKPIKLITLTERIFGQRSGIAMLLQGDEHQKEGSFDKSYHDELIKMLLYQVKSLGNERILVRKNGRVIDKFRNEDNWLNISDVDLSNLKNVVAPLLIGTDDELPMKMDAMVFDCELCMLSGESLNSMVLGNITSLCQYLINKKGNIPQVVKEMSTLIESGNNSFWENASLEDMERVRKVLRELMRFAVDNHDDETFDVDIVDIIDKPRINKPVPIAMSYKEKVIEYLAKNENNAVIQKIFNMEQLTIKDIHELENILWKQLGTKKQYDEYVEKEKKVYGGKVAALIRSLCGINRKRAHEKFAEFIHSETLTAVQEEYLNSIINYVCANGDMQRQNLMKDPYKNFNWVGAFGDKRSQVANYVQYLHNVINAGKVYPKIGESIDEVICMAAEP